MRFDFSSVDDVESYISVPEGLHNCRVAEVREGRSRDGSVRWSYRLEVLDGDYAGRTAAWDSITWSERGVYRVKKVLEAFGLDVRGELEIDPQDLVNLQARVKVEPEEREDPLTGRRQVRMRVPYLGYSALTDAPDEPVEPHEPHEDGLSEHDESRASGHARKKADAEAVAPVDGWSEKGEPSRNVSDGSEEDFSF